MANHPLGFLIRQLREQKGITQEDLARGIIARSNLSRLENGERAPQKRKIEALFQRLGMDASHFTVLISKEESETKDLMGRLKDCLSTNKTAEADQIIKEMEAIDEFISDKFNLQYVLMSKATNLFNKGGDRNRVKTILDEAIELSIPKFSEAKIAKYYLSNQESGIINLMAMVYGELGDFDKAINIGFGLKENFDTCCIDQTHKGKHYPSIIYHLTKYMMMDKRFEESLELCEPGILACLQTGYMFFLPMLVGHKGICLFELGRMAESKELLYDAYHTFKVNRMPDLAETTNKYAKDNLGIDFNEITQYLRNMEVWEK
ncbi:MAG: helix-turn-helix transcriptional regulator [Defluviitaleaceae bacterium]|nr:helix-turn-helix transcriptional regulator [Defluviitaleaceae bacterium]